MHDHRESRETLEALAEGWSVLVILRDSRRRVRNGSAKAAYRLDLAIEAITNLMNASRATVSDATLALNDQIGVESVKHNIRALDGALKRMESCRHD